MLSDRCRTPVHEQEILTPNPLRLASGSVADRLSKACAAPMHADGRDLWFTAAPDSCLCEPSWSSGGSARCLTTPNDSSATCLKQNASPRCHARGGHARSKGRTYASSAAGDRTQATGQAARAPKPVCWSGPERSRRSPASFQSRWRTRVMCLSGDRASAADSPVRRPQRLSATAETTGRPHDSARGRLRRAASLRSSPSGA